MVTSINGQAADWTPAIWAKWHTFADAADPKFLNATVSTANYFVPRPAVDEWNRGSCEEGFVYVVTLKGGYEHKVFVSIVSSLPHPPNFVPPADGTFDPGLSSK